MEEVDAEKGIYKVTLYANGRWVPVIIDNKLPTQYSGRMLKFVNPGNENGYALWAPLLEKAYAKLHINYQNQLSGGYNSEALYTLTGMPFVRYSIAVDGSNVDDIFAKATAADKQKYIISGAVPANRGNGKGGGKNGESQGFHGIVTGHAYTILGTHQFTDGVKVFKIRNPWGVEKYNGPAGDNDSAFWTAARQ